MKLSSRRTLLRRVLQKWFKTRSDTRCGAAIRCPLSVGISRYITIILDLISLAADAQVIMHFYALKPGTASTQRAPDPPLDPARCPETQDSAVAGPSHSIDHGLWLRLPASIIFLDLCLSLQLEHIFATATQIIDSSPQSREEYRIGRLRLSSVYLLSSSLNVGQRPRPKG